MKAFYIALGIVFGLLVNIIVIPYIFSEYYEMKNRNKVDKYKLTSQKETTFITKGVCNLIQSKKVINTYDFRRDLYVNLKPSVNRLGGNQFTYSFWLRRSKSAGLTNKILFFRGTEIKEDMNKGDIYKRDTTIANPVDSIEYESEDRSNDRFVKCPLVRFVDKGLKIEFNTVKDPHKSVTLDAEVFQLLKSSVKNPKYNLITISFQDNFDFGGRERGIKVEVFIDDALVKTSSFENNSLRMNKGSVVLFANDIVQDESQTLDADFAELSYHNYAMNIHDVEALYKKGFADITCQLPDSWKNNEQRYNIEKINLYNETSQIL